MLPSIWMALTPAAHATATPWLFVSDPVAPGRPVHVRVTGSDPGTVVSIYGGLVGGQTCFAFGVCLPIGPQTVFVGDVTTDAEGEGRATFTLPAAVALGPVAISGLVRNGAARSRPTTTVERTAIAPGDWTVLPRHNVVVVVLDDVGVDRLPAYGIDPTPIATPTLDGLAATGVRFENAWSLPSCSPARVALMTGRYARRTGWGVNDTWDASQINSIGAEQITLGELVRLSPVTDWSTGLVGKWHLSAVSEGPDAPRLHGFDHYSGFRGGGMTDHYSWTKSVDGVAVPVTRYSAVEEADDAIAVIGQLPQPFLAVVAFHAPHSEYDAPPARLSTHDALPSDPIRARYDAMLEAVDHELGRVLDSLSPATRARTVVFVVGDNGTPAEIVEPPSDPGRAKFSMYDGGVRVPFLVSGPASLVAQGAVHEGLVQVQDVFATVAELANVDTSVIPAVQAPSAPRAFDGVSLLPALLDPAGPSPHDVLYTEAFSPNGASPWIHDTVAVRNDRFKLVRHMTGTEQLYEYEPGALDEGVELLGCPLDADQQANLDALRVRLDALQASVVFDAQPLLPTPTLWPEYQLVPPEGAPEDRLCVPPPADSGGSGVSP